MYFRHWLTDALEYINKAIEIQPYNSEARGFQGEILGYMGDLTQMRNALKSSEEIFDKLVKINLADNSYSVSTQSIASIYQKLGHTYLTVSF